MAKTCVEEGCVNPVWARKRCRKHDPLFFPEKYQIRAKNTSNSQIDTNIPNNKESVSNAPIQKIKSNYKRKPTGEYKLFLEIYAERKGVCQLTGKQIPFDVNNFAHILGKQAYPSLRLLKENILHILPDAHHLYDHSSKEKLLEKYPTATMIYELKDKLRYKYYNS